MTIEIRDAGTIVELATGEQLALSDGDRSERNGEVRYAGYTREEWEDASNDPTWFVVETTNGIRVCLSTETVRDYPEGHVLLGSRWRNGRLTGESAYKVWH